MLRCFVFSCNSLATREETLFPVDSAVDFQIWRTKEIMTAFKDMKVSGKISLLVGFLLLVQFLTTSFGIIKTVGIGDEIQEIVEQHLPISKIISDIAIHQMEQAHEFDRVVRYNVNMKTDKNALDDFQKAKKRYDALSEAVVAEIAEGIMFVKMQERKTSFRGSSLDLLGVLDQLEQIQEKNLDYKNNIKALLALIVIEKTTDIKNKMAELETKEDQLTNELKVLLRRVEQSTLESAETVAKHEADTVAGMWGLAFFGSIISIILAIFFVRFFSRPLMRLSHSMEEVVTGDYSKRVEVGSRDEVGMLSASFNTMITSIQKMIQNITDQNWLQSNLSMVSDLVQKATDPKHMAQSLIGKLAPLLESGHAAIYVKNQTTERYELLASYGFVERTNMINDYGEGERLVGQCVRENQTILLSRVPDDYIRIGSGLGEAKPQQIIVIPVTFKTSVLAVIELASFRAYSPIQRQLLQELIPIIGLGLENQRQSQHTQLLLEETQRQAEELRTQQEELQVQQEELQTSNETLRNQAEALLKNKAELEVSRAEVEGKAANLQRVSQYKSEFLANMSHELRTPLNSLLILAKILAENSDGNMTEKQVEAGKVIYASGQELLELINNILDLAKVESGKQALNPNPLDIQMLAAKVRAGFSHVAEEKGLALQVIIETDTPNHVISDADKVWQIMKNFIANAIKFTEKGQVAVAFSASSSDNVVSANDLYLAVDTAVAKVLAITVSDSGVGIAAEKREMIFEAFQQADGSTSRKYGGTGLGLSICRELAIVLNGEIRLQSREGEGSTFMLLLPETPSTTGTMAQQVYPAQGGMAFHVARQENRRQTDAGFLEDDRISIGPNDKVVLVMDNNPDRHKRIAALSQQETYKHLWASRGDTGLKLVEQFKLSGIFLDANLGDMAGLTVLQRLKKDVDTRHIPVCVFVPKEQAAVARTKGAVVTLSDPITDEQLHQVFERFSHFAAHNVRRVLVAGKDSQIQTELVDILADDQVNVNLVASSDAAKKLLLSSDFDCLVLEPDLTDGSGVDLLAWLNTQTETVLLPAILYASRNLNKEDQRVLESNRSPPLDKAGD